MRDGWEDGRGVSEGDEWEGVKENGRCHCNGRVCLGILLNKTERM